MEKNTPKEQYLVRRGNSSRGRSKGIKLRNSHPNLVVGGPSDILSTSSKVYSRGRGRGRGRVDRSHVNLMEVVSAVKETFKKQQVQNKPPVDGQQPKEKQEAQVDEPSPDYSACPNLNGPPRPGDNLAFKARCSLLVLLCIILAPIFFSRFSSCLQLIHLKFLSSR